MEERHEKAPQRPNQKDRPIEKVDGHFDLSKSGSSSTISCLLT